MQIDKKENIVYFDKDEHMKEHQDELQKELSGASPEDLVQPQVWAELTAKESKQLRRWVNQFIKANTEQSEKLAIPYMNAKLRYKIQAIETKLRAQAMRKQAEENIKKAIEEAKAVENEK